MTRGVHLDFLAARDLLQEEGTGSRGTKSCNFLSVKDSTRTARAPKETKAAGMSEAGRGRGIRDGPADGSGEPPQDKKTVETDEGR